MKFTLTLLISLIILSCNSKKLDNVIIEQEIPGIKLMATVYLTDRLENSQLIDYAENIYATYNGKDYDNVFIKYMLPNMIDGTGAYATTHYNPILDIKIYEMTQSELSNVKSHFKIKSPYWIDGKILIQFENQNGKTILRQYGNDLTYGEESVIRKITNKDTLYIFPEDENDTYYIHYSSGELDLMDNNGLISRLSN